MISAGEAKTGGDADCTSKGFMTPDLCPPAFSTPFISSRHFLRAQCRGLSSEYTKKALLTSPQTAPQAPQFLKPETRGAGLVSPSAPPRLLPSKTEPPSTKRSSWNCGRLWCEPLVIPGLRVPCVTFFGLYLECHHFSPLSLPPPWSAAPPDLPSEPLFPVPPARPPHAARDLTLGPVPGLSEASGGLHLPENQSQLPAHIKPSLNSIHLRKTNQKQNPTPLTLATEPWGLAPAVQPPLPHPDPVFCLLLAPTKPGPL